VNVDPTFLPFLAKAIAITGVEHYGYLCLEHPDAEVRRGYQGLVIDIAAGTYTGQRYDPDAVPTAQGAPCCGGDLSYPDP
jgi:hypothetical protein